MLRLNGYSTAAFGKWHETAAWEANISGPSDRWPTRQGFDKFYGFIGGETNQWAPFLFDGVTAVELPNDPNYHFMTDMTDKAVSWIKYQKAMTPDKPFFVYFAPGATHAPHHVPKEWIAKWKGKFDQGWDKLREETLARQIKMGIVPPGPGSRSKPAAIKDWDKLSADEKRLFTHQVEVFAAYLDYTDHEIGRMLKAVETTGQADNTLVFYIAGDNGTSGEGGENGMFNEYTYFNGVHEKVPDLLKLLDKWGGPETYPHMAAGWSVALDAPFGWMKQVASDFGGTRNGMVVHWPKGIKAKNEIRTQFSHVIDVAPTILEAAGLPEPKVVNGTPQIPMEGVSLAVHLRRRPGQGAAHHAVLRDRRQPRHLPRRLVRAHHPPGAVGAEGAQSPAERRLGAVRQRADFSLANDLAAKDPEKLAEMQALFMKEARERHVLPLDDRTFERALASAVGRPDVMEGRTSLTLGRRHDGDDGERLHQREEQVQDDHGRSRGAGGRRERHHHRAGRPLRRLVALREGRGAGLRLQLPRPARASVAGTKPLAPGKATIRFDFAYDGGGLGKGGTGTLFVNDRKPTEGLSLFYTRLDRDRVEVREIEKMGRKAVDSNLLFIEEIRRHRWRMCIGEEGKGFEMHPSTA